VGVHLLLKLVSSNAAMPDATGSLPAGVAPLAQQAIALQLIAACEMEWQQGRCRIAFDANRRDRCLY